MKAWPFLVSRNATIGYQTIVAPDFMIDAQVAGILATSTGGNVTEEPQYKRTSHSAVGDITLAYRVVQATENGVVLRDESSRPILWIEGLVLRGIYGQGVTRSDLEHVHQQVIHSFRKFWTQTGHTRIEPSYEIQVPIVEPTPRPPDVVPVPEAPPTILPSPSKRPEKRVTVRVVGAVLAAVGIGVLALILLRNTAQNQAIQATVEALATENVSLRATIEALLTATPPPMP